MTDNWQSLGSITTTGIIDKLQPVKFEVALQGPLAAALEAEASKCRVKPETLIREAVRSYLGEG